MTLLDFSCAVGWRGTRSPFTRLMGPIDLSIGGNSPNPLLDWPQNKMSVLNCIHWQSEKCVTGGLGFFLILHCAGDFLIENSAVFSCIKTRGDDLKLHQGCSGLDIRKNFSWKNGNALAQTAKRGGGVTVLRDVQETWRNGTDDCDFGDTMGTGWWLGFVILVVFSNLGDSVVLSFCFSLRLLVLMHTPSKKALSVSVLSLISPTHTSLCTNPFVPEKTSITEVIGTIASAFDVTSSGFLQSTCQFKPWLSC